jgi:hypothetical protein
MNERINELAEQAGYSKDYLEIGLPSNMEKFAELIVKECLTIMQDANQSKLRLSDAIWNTKIHFGVEE